MIPAAIYFTDMSPGFWETIVWSMVVFLIVVAIAALFSVRQ